MSDDYTPEAGGAREDFTYPWEGLNPGRRGRLAAFVRWMVEHDRQVAAESAKAEQSKFIEWLIDIAYPFDFRFDSKPPVDGDALARQWNERNNWGVSHEEAAAMIFEESGILTAWEKHKAAPDE